MSLPASARTFPGAVAAEAPSGAGRALDVRAARQTTRTHAKTFALACRLLPRRLRDDVYLLYQVFRSLDDLVDERRAGAEATVAAVEAWAAGAGPADVAEVAALEALARRHPIDRRAIADFCAGMRRDLRRERFGDEAAVERYCYEVAGTVGVVMSDVLGSDGDPTVREAAAALGIAMQRTNILRDLDEDRAAGRDYVSAESVRRHGPPLPGARAAFMAAQIAHADALYDQGLQGIRHLRAGRAAIRAAAAMYREILRELERRDGGELPGRAVVSRRRKLWVGLRALSRR